MDSMPLLFFLISIASAVGFAIILYRIMTGVDYVESARAGEPPPVREIQLSTFGEIQIIVVLDDDAAPMLPEEPPPHCDGMVYETCDSAGESGDECAICLEEYKGGERRATVAVCGHRFHGWCMERWLAEDKKHTCPLCRRVVF